MCVCIGSSFADRSTAAHNVMHRLICFTVLATPVFAQIPVDAAMILESTPLTADYYRLVDTLGRGATTVRSQSVFMPIDSLAVDPTSAGEFYYLGGAQSFAGTWQAQMQPLANIGANLWGPWSDVPADRLAVGLNFVGTIAGTTLELYPKPGNLPLQSFTVPTSVDLAFFNDLVYVAGDGTFGLAPVVELDPATGFTRTVGSYNGTTCIAVSDTGTELCVGTASGTLLRIDVATGSVLLTIPTGLGAITAVDYTRFGTLVYTDGIELWSELVPAAPIYVSPSSILDFGVARVPVASIVPFGEGCGLGAASSWASGGVPTLGNTSFSLGIRGAQPSSLALLAAGNSRAVWTATGALLPFDLQPLGAFGCQLLVDPQVTVVVTTDAAGAADQPLPIPNTTSLIGAEFVGQWFVPDGVVGAFGFASSEGVAFVIG